MLIILIVAVIISYLVNCNRNDCELNKERLAKTWRTLFCTMAFFAGISTTLDTTLGLYGKDVKFNETRCLYELKQLYVPNGVDYSVQKLKTHSLLGKTYQYTLFLIHGDDNATKEYYEKKLAELGWQIKDKSKGVYVKDNDLELELINSFKNQWEINIYAKTSDTSKSERIRLEELVNMYTKKSKEK